METAVWRIILLCEKFPREGGSNGGDILDDLEKDELIKQKLKKYKSIFKQVPKDKKIFVEKLYSQAAFMEVTLNELQETINIEGAIITSTNGNGFEVTQEHPAQVSYNKMIRNYTVTIKALVDMLPEDKEEKDDLTEFLLSGKK